jgi:hypothetical protein
LAQIGMATPLCAKGYDFRRHFGTVHFGPVSFDRGCKFKVAVPVEDKIPRFLLLPSKSQGLIILFAIVRRVIA